MNAILYLSIHIYPAVRSTDQPILCWSNLYVVKSFSSYMQPAQLDNSHFLHRVLTRFQQPASFLSRILKNCTLPCLPRKPLLFKQNLSSFTRPGDPGSSTKRHRIRLYWSTQLARLLLVESCFSSHLCSFFFFSLWTLIRWEMLKSQFGLYYSFWRDRFQRVTVTNTRVKLEEREIWANTIKISS